MTWENKHCRVSCIVCQNQRTTTIIIMLVGWSSCVARSISISNTLCVSVDHPLWLCKQSKLTIRQLTWNDMTYSSRTRRDIPIPVARCLFTHIRPANTHDIYMCLHTNIIFIQVTHTCFSLLFIIRNLIMMCRKVCVSCDMFKSSAINIHSSKIETTWNAQFVNKRWNYLGVCVVWCIV